MELIEDEKIGLEYEIINDVVSIRRVYVKDNAKVEEEEDKPLTSYEYVSNYEYDCISGVVLNYSDFSKNEFTLKISGADIPTLEIQRLVVLVSDEFIDKVAILSDNTGLRVFLDDSLEEVATFSKEFFDAFSKEVTTTIKEVKTDGLIDFCSDIVYVSRDETPKKFKQLITYIDKALI